jgi:hypothetical protein
MAARQPQALVLLFVTLVSAAAASTLGVSIVGQWIAVVGSAAFVGFVAFHALSPAHGNALYGPLGPPVDPEVQPGDIASLEVRSAYDSVLRAYRKIRRSLDKRDGTTQMLVEPYRRCGELVRLAGRIARVANALQDHIEDYDRNRLSADVSSLRQLASAARDPHARRAYTQTADARQHQLENYDEFCGLLERIQARLELIAASLESVQSLIVKLHVRLLEQTALEGGSMSEGLDVLRDDLEILEAAMDEALYGPIDKVPPLPLDALEHWNVAES